MGMSAAGSRRGRRGGGFRDINVTPLVDVMLVLLVVFMVTAPLLSTGLPIQLPKAEATNMPVEEEALVITVTEDERVFLGEKEITDDIKGGLKNDENLKAKKELYVQADSGAHYGVVAGVIAEARLQGVEALNLLVEPAAESASKSGKPKKGKAPAKKP